MYRIKKIASGVCEKLIGGNGNSFLFLVIVCAFALMALSGTLFLISTHGKMERQNIALSTTMLVSSIEIAIPMIGTSPLDTVDASDFPGLSEASNDHSTHAIHFVPFLVDTDFNINSDEQLPPELLLLIKDKLSRGDYTEESIHYSDAIVKTSLIKSGGSTWNIVVAQINDKQYLGLAQNLTPIVMNARSLEILFIGVLIAVYIIFIALLYLVLRLVTKPLNLLTDAARKYTAGDFNVKVTIPRTVSELWMLGKVFNEMGFRLNEQKESLEAYSKDLILANDLRGKALEELSRRNSELGAMNEATMLANKLKNTDQVIELAINRLRDDLNLACVYFHSPAKDGGYIVIQQTGSNPGRKHILPSKLDRLLKATAHTGAPQFYYLNSINARVGMTDPEFELLSSFGDRYFYPVSMDSNTTCVIEMVCTRGSTFPDDSIKFAQMFIAHMEVILRNKALYGEANRRSHELERINQVTRMISSELKLDNLFQEVVSHTQNTIRAEGVIIGVVENNALIIKSVEPVENDLVRISSEFRNDDILNDIIMTGQGVVISDLRDDERITSSNFLMRKGYRAFLGLPIVNKDKVVGVLCGCSHMPGAFSESDSYFMSLLSGQVGIAIDNAKMFDDILTRDRRRDQQLSVARKLQMERVPDYFKQGIAAVNCQLTAADELAGDFFDVFSIGRHSVAIVIGDVANKGIAASLMTFSLLSMFRNNARTLTSPCDILNSINRSLINQIKDDCWFATGFYAKLNTKTRTFTYSSAGHEMPIWYHAGENKVDVLESAGYPLGLFSSFKYKTREVELGDGDKIVFYTDGVPDAMSPDGERFGHERLLDLVKKYGDLTGQELSRKIIEELDAFTQTNSHRDDIIVAVLDLQDDPWVHRLISFDESGELVNDILQALTPYKLNQKDIYSIRLAVDEAIANAWRHGLGQRDDARFKVSYLISDEGFSLRVLDAGTGFDHESLPDPTVEENLFKTHGRGVFLIRQVMDEVEFNDSGNEIAFYKQFPSTGNSVDNERDALLLESRIESIKAVDSLRKAKLAGEREEEEEDPNAIADAFLRSIGESFDDS
ncbi:MAG TPA: SpoIIE family protein phosphatase [bacterium]|jgi:sigma-B regulation protein RsbU (phosphoserine phosphatase)